MGFLLLQYEYQRASREVSVHQRAGIRLDNQVTRYTKRVEKMQSVFEKNKTRLENRYQALSNDASAALSSASASASQLALRDACNMLNFQFTQIGVGGISLANMGCYVDPSAVAVDQNGNVDKSSLMTALSTAAARARSVLTNLITMVKEEEMDRLEAQQDEQLTPISEKEADLQAEKDLEDTLCTMWEQRRDNAKQKLPDAIQNGMAAYGIK